MNQKKLGIAIFILLILSVCWIIFKPVSSKPSDLGNNISDAMSISALHEYKNNHHTIVGSLMLGTPCEKLTTEAVVRESSPEQVTLLFSTENTSDTCAQVITKVPFEIEFSASKGAKINAMLNSAPVKLDLSSANTDDITKFKLNIK
jgi:hypothetical protein